MNYRTNTTNIVIAGLMIALGLIIPTIFHAAGMGGKVFLPMHIPVLLAGFLLPPIYALLVGMATPIISSLLTGMPPIFPMAIIMMFELGTYAIIASFLYRKLRIPLIISLILSMISGRAMAGLVVYILTLAFSVQGLGDPIIFLKAGAILAIPGIIIQIILIPILMHGINRYTTINLD
nr:ECF transporter S component [Tissierella sp.]